MSELEDKIVRQAIRTGLLNPQEFSAGVFRGGDFEPGQAPGIMDVMRAGGAQVPEQAGMLVNNSKEQIAAAAEQFRTAAANAKQQAVSQIPPEVMDRLSGIAGVSRQKVDEVMQAWNSGELAGEKKAAFEELLKRASAGTGDVKLVAGELAKQAQDSGRSLLDKATTAIDDFRGQAPGLIDTGRQAVSEGMSDAERFIQEQQLLPGLSLPTTSDRSDDGFKAFNRATAMQVADNVLSVGRMGTDFLNQSARSAVAVGTGGFRPSAEQFSPLNRDVFPTGEQIITGAQTAGNVFTGTKFGELEEQFQRNLAEGRNLQRDNPFATVFGTGVGDAATLQPIRAGGKALKKSLGMFGGREVASAIDNPGIRQAGRVAIDKMVKTLGPSVTRTAEAGLEGAVLGMITSGDPLHMAGISAGAQSAGNLFIGARDLLSRKGVATGFLNLLLAHQLFKAVGPGERNIFESSDEAINEILFAYGAGALSSVLGARRIDRSGDFYRNFSETVTDAITSVPRATLASTIDQLTNDDRDGLGFMAAEKISSNPNNFTDTQIKRLERAINNGEYIAELEKMIETVPSFREALGL